MGRGNRQAGSVTTKSISADERIGRYEAWNKAADRYDPQRVFSRDIAWERAFVWQEMQEDEQIDFLLRVMENTRNGKGDRDIEIENVSVSQNLIFTTGTTGSHPLVTRVFSPESVFYPAASHGPSGNFLYTSQAEEGAERAEAKKILEMLTREGYSVTYKSIAEHSFAGEREASEPLLDTAPAGRAEALQKLLREGLSEEEAEGRLQEMHWTEWHPDSEFWSPVHRALARTMSQDAYEAIYGRGVAPAGEETHSEGISSPLLRIRDQFIADRGAEDVDAYGPDRDDLEIAWEQALPWYSLTDQERMEFLEHEVSRDRLPSESLCGFSFHPAAQGVIDVHQFGHGLVFSFSPHNLAQRRQAAEQLFQLMDGAWPAESQINRWASEKIKKRIADYTQQWENR